MCVEYSAAAIDCLQCAEAVLLSVVHREQMYLFLTRTLSRFVYLMHRKTDRDEVTYGVGVWYW